MFPLKKPALLNTIARGMTGHDVPANTTSLYTLLNQDSLNNIAESISRKIWNGTITFGCRAVLLGIFVVIQVEKLIIDTATRGYTLRALYGWSLHLIRVLWSSITHLLVRMGKTDEHEKKNPEAAEIRLQEHQQNPSIVNDPRPHCTIIELKARILSRQMSNTHLIFENRRGCVTSSGMNPANSY